MNRAMFPPLSFLRISLCPPVEATQAQPSPARRWAAASALFCRRSLESTPGAPSHGSLRRSNTMP